MGLGLFLAHQHHQGGTVIDGGGIGCGYPSILLKRGAQFGHALKGGAKARRFVLADNHRVAFALGNGDRQDLFLEPSGCNRRLSAVLADHGEIIHLFPGDGVLVCDVFSRDAHMDVAESISQAVSDHAVNQLCVSHAFSPAGVLVQIRRLAHVFDTACHHGIRVAQHDGLGAQLNRFQA